MILARNVFRLKFGKAKEAIALWQEGVELLRTAGVTDTRMMTDLTGPFYTLVLENTYDSVSAMESTMGGTMGTDQWEQWYQRFVPLVESGHRELFTIVSSPTQATAGRGQREASTAGRR